MPKELKGFLYFFLGMIVLGSVTALFLRTENGDAGPPPASATAETESESPTADESARVAEVAPPPRQFRMSGNQIVTDTFDVRYDLRDGRLTLALDSDLGDGAELMVSVSRIYQELGSDEQYPIDYFSARSTVGAWREPRTISLDHDGWKREIEQRQRVFTAAGEPFTVSRIADDIEISFVVPVNQEPPFEPWNANLTGSVVRQHRNLRIVESRVLARYPIDATNVGQTRFADPLNLANETTYRTSGGVPLVADIDPPDPIAAIASVRRLNQGEEFTVLKRTSRGNTPWYHVRTHLGEGWINSVALLGQEIVVVR